jgi:hypothetical protein
VLVPLLTEAARLVLGTAAPEALTVCRSEFFAAPAQIAELQPHAHVVAVPATRTKDESLTAMRRLMVDEGGAAAVLAIGGRTTEDGQHITIDQRHVTAIALDTGELACRHRRSYAKHRTITALEHARALKSARRAAAERWSRSGRRPATRR